MRVEPRRSTNIATTGRSRSRAVPGRRALATSAAGGSRGITETSRRGRVWQASRTFGGASMRASASASWRSGGASVARPSLMRTRHVVQRARPPHTEACGKPASRTASRMLRPIGALITRPEAWRSW